MKTDEGCRGELLKKLTRKARRMGRKRGILGGGELRDQKRSGIISVLADETD